MCVIIAGAFLHAVGPVNKGPVAQSSIIGGCGLVRMHALKVHLSTASFIRDTVALHMANYTIQPMTL